MNKHLRTILMALALLLAFMLGTATSAEQRGLAPRHSRSLSSAEWAKVAAANAVLMDDAVYSAYLPAILK